MAAPSTPVIGTAFLRMMLDRFYPIVDSAAWLARLLPLGVRLVQLRVKDRPEPELRARDPPRPRALRGGRRAARRQRPLAAGDRGGLRLRPSRPGGPRRRRPAGDPPRRPAPRRQHPRRGRARRGRWPRRPDYVALGPIYPTILKEMHWAPQGLDRVREWKRRIGALPLVAIGGLTVERAAGVFAAGADIVSVVTDITLNPDPEARVRAWIGADAMNRYARQIVLPEVGAAGQARLAAAHVLVVGAGGLGAPVLQYLAGAGVGRITVVDPDAVERGNLHRQTLYGERSLGQPKAAAAAVALADLNPEVAVAPLVGRLDPEIAPALVRRGRRRARLRRQLRGELHAVRRLPRAPPAADQRLRPRARRVCRRLLRRRARRCARSSRTCRSGRRPARRPASSGRSWACSAACRRRWRWRSCSASPRARSASS